MRIDTSLRLAFLTTALLVSACGGGSSSDTTAVSAPGPAPGPAPAPGGDVTAPVVSLTSPANLSANLTGVLSIAATATDDTGVANVEFQVDGARVGSLLTAGPYTSSVDTTQYTSGQHVIRARATDAAGNVSTWSSATVTFDGARTQPAGITLNESWVTGLTSPTALAQAPDGRIFVTQQGGALRVIENGALLNAPFVQLTVDSTEERGLLGIALHPNFASNHYVYLYYTTTQGGAHNRISRFVASGDTVGAVGEQVLVDLPALSSYTDHNGGGMHFGADGKLYVGVGDNNNGAQAQDLTLPFGKLLRYNDDGTIPTDNPFGNAIWAYGLRNPYTSAVEPGTGRIFINDVGEDTWEEIDLATKGANYGWPTSEGPDNLTSAMTAPLFAYKHTAASPPGSGPGGFIIGQALTGGAFYPSTGNFPASYAGTYFFADFSAHFIDRYDAVNGAAYAFGSLNGFPVDMLVGLDGALYVLTYDGFIARFSVTP